jgi:DNA-binding LacI/PurR family transcriptional regulator
MAEKTIRRPTIDDVAREAGVSIATVSRVINRTVPVAPQTMERVLTAIKKLNYQPQAAARILASRKTNTIGLLIPEISGYFFLPIILGIESAAYENGYSLLIHTYMTAEDRLEGHMPLSLGEHNTDGLIVFAHSLTIDELHQFHDAGFPMVLLHQTPPAGLAIPNVTFENKMGSRQLVEHLVIEHHYQKIAFLAGPEDHEDSYWREMGYIEALIALGIDYNPDLKFAGNFDAQQAKNSVTELLAEHRDIDAIFAADDESASGAMMAIRESGLRIPEDVAVVGFDDTQLAPHLLPPLTTIHAPIEEVGRQAALQLIQLISGESVDPVTLLPTELIIRESCGCVKS